MLSSLFFCGPIQATALLMGYNFSYMNRAALLLSTLLSVGASAQCNGFWLFPAPGAVVPLNVQFVLEGLGDEQARTLSLVGGNTLSLVGGGSEVALKVEKGYVSALGRTAIHLVPKDKLKPETQYTLRGLGSERMVLNSTDGEGRAQWTTGLVDDKKAPVFTSKPAVTGGEYFQSKTGLVRRLLFRTVVDDTSASFLVVTAQRAKGSNIKQTYPVFMNSGTFFLGQKECEGNLSFDDGRAYKLQFELYDSAGNKSLQKAALEVAAPRPL
jgi:hypothetical protein